METRRKEKRKDYYKENVLVLPTYKKFLFFLMVIPYLIPLFTIFYKLEGELLKLNQGKYYSIMGFVALAVGSFSEAIIKVEWLSYCFFITVFLALLFVVKRFESVFLPIISERMTFPSFTFFLQNFEVYNLWNSVTFLHFFLIFII